MKSRKKPSFVQSRSYSRFNDILGQSDNPADILCHEENGKISFIELFIESVYRRHLILRNGEISVLSEYTDEGFGCRFVRHDHMHYYYMNHLEFNSRIDFMRIIRNMTAGKIDSERPNRIHENKRNPSDHEQQFRVLNAAYEAGRNVSWKIDNVTAEWEESCRSYRVINSEHANASGNDHLMNLTVKASASNGSSVYQGLASEGGRYVQNDYLDINPIKAGKAAAEKVLEQMSAKPCPAGVYPVILAAGRCGVVIHEIIAHQLEADVLLNGLSCFSNRLGERVAPPFVNIVDDGTIPRGPGASAIDDEGTPIHRNVLIENGILKNLLHNRFTSRQMGVSPTGSARRESYAYPPIPRVRNMLFDAGSLTTDDLIRPVKNGLYVTSVTHGQADPLTGAFVFIAQEGCWIEDGKLVYPIMPALITGNSRDILERIDAAGNDKAMETGLGFCVKDGQRVPVRSGHPTIRIRSMLIQPTL